MDDFEKNSTNEVSDSDLSEQLRILLSNTPLILAVTALFAIAATVYLSSLPNLYTATVRILVEKVSTFQSSQEILAPSYRGEEDYYGTQIAILTGRRISTIVQKELGNLPVVAMDARKIPKTRILVLSVTARDPQAAAQIANKYAEVYVREGNREDLFVGEQMMKLLPEEMDSKDVQLMEETGSMEEMKAFNKKEYAESLAAITNDVVVQKLRNARLEQQAKLNALLQRYKPSHPSVKEVSEQLEYVENELKDRTKKILSNIRSSLAGESRIRNMKILEEAFPPRKPSAPNRPRGIAIFSFLGFLVGAGISLFMEHANQKIRSDRDFNNVSLPFLGQVPLLNSLLVYKKKKIEMKKQGFSLVEFLKTDAVLSDSIVSVRTHILFSMPYEKSRRIMITSCIPDEGKTTISVLLSISLSTLGRKILLIDADMRRPFAHNYLGMRNEKGLSDYLTGQASLESVIKEVPNTSLRVITAGNPSPNPSELVASEQFRALLEYADANFDRVVIDVPPVLFIPDGLIVAKYIHSGVLVCGSGMIHKKTVGSIKEKFQSIGHSFIGIVVNKVNFEKATSRYKYYQSYRSYYAKTAPAKSEAS